MMNWLTRKTIPLLCAVVIALPCVADVKISNLQDFNFGLYPGVGNLQDNKNVCANVIPNGGYQIVMFGDGGGGSFEISSGIDNIPYRVFYNDRDRRGGAIRMQPGQPLTGQSRASDQLDCSDGLNANIRIRMRIADLQAANPGRYRGTLTMTISPE
jgi:hypothetical protein